MGDTVSPPKSKVRPTARAGYLAWTAALGLALLATVDARQYDSLAALSAIPPWCWWLGAALIAGLVLIRCSPRTRLAVVATLLMIGANWVEQFTTVTRSALDLVSADQPAPWLRVVSVNCSAGSRRAAEEVAAVNPDVILLQESPGEDVLTELAGNLFGTQAGVLVTGDCSILARGKLQLIHESRHFLHAVLHRADGRMLQLVCVRLLPPVVRYDLWNPSCWREHREAREKRRAEAREIIRSLSEIAPRDLIVVGGDCNAPAGDGALQEWASVIQDAFGPAGRGWGATVLNRLPVQRFDQVWSTATLTPRRVTAMQSSYSDHRIVVADFATPTDNLDPSLGR